MDAEMRARQDDGVTADDIKLMEPDLDGVYVANPKGCDQCIGGHSGRTVLAEVVETDSRLMALLLMTRLIRPALTGCRITAWAGCRCCGTRWAKCARVW